MAEIDTLISSLNRRNDELTAEKARMHLENTKWRTQLREVQKERDELKAALGPLTAERDTWKQKAEATPKELQARVDELSGELKSRDHRDAFLDVLHDELNEGVTVSDVWAKLGYKPGDGTPTPEQIKEQVAPLRESARFLFRPAPAGSGMPGPGGATQGRQPPPSLTTAIAPGRGAPDNAARRFEVRKSQSRDPRWMRVNRDAIEEARKAGTLTFIDDV
jgi:hypothetical protein